jgi:hypothetical protein
MATPQGIPLVSISRDNYDAVADALSQRLGVPKSWVADAMTVNGAELFASSFGVIALALNWTKDDKERFGDIAATIGLSGAFSANPVLGLVSLISLAKAFQQGRQDKNETSHQTEDDAYATPYQRSAHNKLQCRQSVRPHIDHQALV